MPEQLRALRSFPPSVSLILRAYWVRIKLNILIKTDSLKEKMSRTFRAAGKMIETMEWSIQNYIFFSSYALLLFRYDTVLAILSLAP